jgi:hypothetical protein
MEDIPGVLGVEGYRIHKRKVLSTRAQSEVYLAQHSGIEEEIVVKVLKTQRSRDSADNRRALIDCAEAWLREYNVQNGNMYTFSTVKLRSFSIWLTG